MFKPRPLYFVASNGVFSRQRDWRQSRELMAKPQLVPPAPEIPTPELWQGPLAWVGSPPRPAEVSIEYPPSAVFVRGAASLTLSQTVGAGMTRQTVHNKSVLIRLERGKAVEFHVAGEHRCWTYRLEKAGRKLRWNLYAGLSYPGTELVEPPAFDGSAIEYVNVQSLLTMAGTGRGVCFMIHDDGSMEDLATMSDPDADD